MVVLSAALVGKNRTLLARQFVEMTRLRVDGLLSAFPKLVDTEKGKDHTYIETESVRYVYQPMENIFLIIITNKSSNILEDLETLRLLANCVQDQCSQVSEEAILQHAFDIVFAFDEAITFGYREQVNLTQIKTFLEMESADEKLHQRVEQAKMNEAREMAKKKAMELDKAKRIDMRGPGSGDMGVNEIQAALERKGTTAGIVTEAAAVDDTNAGVTYHHAQMDVDVGAGTIKANMPKKGMQLGKKKAAPAVSLNAFAAAPAAEVVAKPAEQVRTSGSGAAPAAAIFEKTPAPINPLAEPLNILIEESVEATLALEGGLEGEAKVDGKFEITVYDESKADLASFKLSPQDTKFKYKVHPNLNKQSQANDVLEIRDTTKTFRANAAAALLKWRATPNDESTVPITFECWPSETESGVSCIIELELTDTNKVLENVMVQIPCPGPCEVNNVDGGEAKIMQGFLAWRIEKMDKANSTGNLEFTAKVDSSTLVPMNLTARCTNSNVWNVQIEKCYHQSRGDELKYALKREVNYNLNIGG